ncbi:hypothetical protein AVEN_254877-1 [Araneus ventricosus]|uniref:Uncharacterized protein n=1 Tax=Araneus ventricosus TaxID=182803 RepID=A0A4Y2VIW7_ARAVE|nr:hypothetical protein AVEN_254877-1 [Araneus ventricosus]
MNSWCSQVGETDNNHKNTPALLPHPGHAERPAAATKTPAQWPTLSPHYERLMRRFRFLRRVRPIIGDGPEEPHHPPLLGPPGNGALLTYTTGSHPHL